MEYIPPRMSLAFSTVEPGCRFDTVQAAYHSLFQRTRGDTRSFWLRLGGFRFSISVHMASERPALENCSFNIGLFLLTNAMSGRYIWRADESRILDWPHFCLLTEQDVRDSAVRMVLEE